jgi:hypothetical protein
MQKKNVELIDKKSMDQRAQRMIEISADEEWTPFLEKVNNMLIEEKKLRHEDDNIKLAELCKNIVSP